MGWVSSLRQLISNFYMGRKRSMKNKTTQWYLMFLATIVVLYSSWAFCCIDHGPSAEEMQARLVKANKLYNEWRDARRKDANAQPSEKFIEAAALANRTDMIEEAA